MIEDNKNNDGKEDSSDKDDNVENDSYTYPQKDPRGIEDNVENDSIEDN